MVSPAWSDRISFDSFFSFASKNADAWVTSAINSGSPKEDIMTWFSKKRSRSPQNSVMNHQILHWYDSREWCVMTSVMEPCRWASFVREHQGLSKGKRTEDQLISFINIAKSKLKTHFSNITFDNYNTTIMYATRFAIASKQFTQKLASTQRTFASVVSSTEAAAPTKTWVPVSSEKPNRMEFNRHIFCCSSHTSQSFFYFLLLSPETIPNQRIENRQGCPPNHAHHVRSGLCRHVYAPLRINILQRNQRLGRWKELCIASQWWTSNTFHGNCQTGRCQASVLLGTRETHAICSERRSWYRPRGMEEIKGSRQGWTVKHDGRGLEQQV